MIEEATNFLKIGLTGGMGSGKTIVSKIFKTLGVPLFYADIEAKKAYFDPIIKNQIIKIFGPDIYISENKINKQLIASIIFNDENQLKNIQNIIHPYVENRFIKWCEVQQSKSKAYGIKEAAILFESGSHKNVEKTICVTAPESIRIKRIMNRDGLGQKEIASRMSHQMQQDEKAKLADYLIHNDETSLLIPQVLSVHESILSDSRASK